VLKYMMLQRGLLNLTRGLINNKQYNNKQCTQKKLGYAFCYHIIRKTCVFIPHAPTFGCEAMLLLRRALA
jgi:hypothetical protein